MVITDDLLLDCDSRAVKNEVDKWVSVNLSLWFEIQYNTLIKNVLDDSY